MRMQFQRGEIVALFDLEDSNHVVAIAKVSGVWGSRDLFRIQVTHLGRVRVGIIEVMDAKFPLLHLHEPAEQYVVGDTINGITLWIEAHMKRRSISNCSKRRTMVHQIC